MHSQAPSTGVGLWVFLKLTYPGKGSSEPLQKSCGTLSSSWALHWKWAHWLWLSQGCASSSLKPYAQAAPLDVGKGWAPNPGIPELQFMALGVYDVLNPMLRMGSCTYYCYVKHPGFTCPQSGRPCICRSHCAEFQCVCRLCGVGSETGVYKNQQAIFPWVEPLCT